MMQLYNKNNFGYLYLGKFGFSLLQFPPVYCFYYIIALMKKLTVLGSTGSIGTQALEVLENIKDFEYEILALCGGCNVQLLIEQVKKFNPKKVCVQNSDDVGKIKSQFPKLDVLYGEEGMVELCSDKENDIILAATSGRIGLKPTLKAIENGIDIALANKETLVMAGEIVIKKARENSVNILPVDSEHSAIFQCTQDFSQVSKIIITASGGPFLYKTKEEIQKATCEDALRHPKWNMGKKITIDSSTLMNKGLEVIEAHYLFGLTPNQIDVVIHPQSIVHSAVEFTDGSVIAQLGEASMHIPIQYALTYPNRTEGIKTSSFDFIGQSLTFEKPDFEKFPCLKLAYEALNMGQTMTTALNAANDCAVEKFLNKEIGIYDIVKIVEKVMSEHKVIQNPTLEDVLEVDNSIRNRLHSTKTLI